MKRSINQRLDDLFHDWKPGRSRFHQDGLLCGGDADETAWRNARIKILFLAKEPNNPKSAPWDFRTWYHQNGVMYVFGHRISEWAVGILKDFPSLAKITDEQRNSCLLSTALMNIKKVGGRANSSPSEISMVIKNDRERLLKQLRIIRPDVVIGGLGSIKLYLQLFGAMTAHPFPNDVTVLTNGEFLLVHWYHPSARRIRKASYVGLKKLFRDPDFKRLLRDRQNRSRLKSRGRAALRP